MADRQIKLARTGGSCICLAIATGKRSTRFYMTNEQALLLSARLEEFAAGRFGIVDVLTENEPS